METLGTDSFLDRFLHAHCAATGADPLAPLVKDPLLLNHFDCAPPTKHGTASSVRFPGYSS